MLRCLYDIGRLQRNELVKVETPDAKLLLSPRRRIQSLAGVSRPAWELYDLVRVCLESRAEYTH
jgi:hypothetical protein